jgi:hypothetical protein
MFSVKGGYVMAEMNTKVNYTHDMIKATRQCNISVISQEATFDLFKHFGFQSGRDNLAER